MDPENSFSRENSLLESTNTSSIIYQKSFSKIELRTPLSERKELQKTPSSAENISKSENKTNFSGIGVAYASLLFTNETKTPKKNATIVQDCSKLKKLPKFPKNDLASISGVKKLMRTPKQQKSPRNDLTNVAGVKKLLQTPKLQKSPRNDLTEIVGVKRLMRTPKYQKSPKNDLTKIVGVKRLMQTPKYPKSPKNDLTDVRGLRRLLQTPKNQKSPKNDLTEIVGIRKLMQSPREQKSPRNDLTDVSGVKKLFRTPKEQKSPKNDLTDVKGLRRLLQTPKQQKSPRNDLTEIGGIKKLMQTPKDKKSPKNDLTEISGINKLFCTPKEQKSPKNDLTKVKGVKELLQTPRQQKEPRNDLGDVSGVKDLFEREEEFGAAAAAFDKLTQRKPIITYRGKSLSPEKHLASTSKRQSIQNVYVDVKPEVKKWVSEQLITKGKARKRKFSENLVVEQPVPKKRTTRKAKHTNLESPIVTSTKRITRRRDAKEKEIRNEIIEKPNDVIIEKNTKTKNKKIRRNKNDVTKDTVNGSNESIVSNDGTITEVLQNRIRIPATVSSDESVINVKTQQKTKVGTRARKLKQDLENQSEECTLKLSSPTEAPPGTRTRGRKPRNNQEPAIQSEVTNLSANVTAPEPERRTRSRRQNKGKEMANQIGESILSTETSVQEQKKSPVRRAKNPRIFVEVPLENKRITRKTKKPAVEDQNMKDEIDNNVRTTRGRVTRKGTKESPVTAKKGEKKLNVHFENLNSEKASTPTTKRKRKILSTEELNNAEEPSPIRRSARTRKN